MPVTLAEVQKNLQDDLAIGVIDLFRKSNFILDNIPFHAAVSPTGGGATFTYGYTRLKTQPTAGFRAVNEEYSSQSVEKERHTVDLKIFGGAFEIDRILDGAGGIVSETQLQMQQKIKAAQALFNDTVINGDSAVDSKAFDGLDKAIAGSDTEFDDGVIDLSTSVKVDENFQLFLDALDEFLLSLNGAPNAIMGNSKLVAKIRAVARRAGMYMTERNSFGEQIEYYGPTPIVDLGAKAGTNDPVVGTNPTSGETSLYVARFGLDGFHAVSMTGQPPVNVWLPDFKTAGAVKKGEVEMVAAVALKETKAAGAMRKIKVQ